MYVSTIIVDKEFRGMGVGEALWRSFLRKHPTVTTRTWSTNETHDLYGNTLIVIDAQKEFINEEDVCLESVQWLNQHKLDYDSIIFTNFTNKPESMFVKHLDYSECMMGGSLIFDNSEIPLNSWFLPKASYGLPFDVSVAMNNVSDVTIIGCELDACIMAVCFQLWDAGIDFKVLIDYCWTNNEEVEQSFTNT